MSCPWRPNTWEKVAWLQVRVSSMAVPLAHAEGKEREEGDEGRSATLRHIKIDKWRCKKEEKEEGMWEGQGGCGGGEGGVLLPSAVEAGV